jgi:hypothetical protein
MKIQTRHFPAILAVLAMLLLSSLACSFSGTTIGADGTEINVSLKENAINKLLENSNTRLDDNDTLMKRITRVELHDGFLRVFGDYDRPGKGEASGSYDVTFRAEDGALKGEITGVDIEGASLSDARVERLNDELTDALASSARESKGEVEFKSVSITEEALNMQVYGTRNK